MSEKYRLMIYFAVGTLHFYRKSLRPYQFGESIEQYASRNNDVLCRVQDEAQNLFTYSMSNEQLQRAVAAFLAPGQSIDDYGPATLVPKEEGENPTVSGETA